MLISVTTKERSLSLSMLPHNGILSFFITYNWWYMLILYAMISFHPKGLYAKLYIPDLTSWIIVCFHLNLLPFLIPCIMFSCSGLTNSNYTELSQLYEKYKSKGFLSSLLSLCFCFVLFSLYLFLSCCLYSLCYLIDHQLFICSNNQFYINITIYLFLIARAHKLTWSTQTKRLIH